MQEREITAGGFKFAGILVLAGLALIGVGAIFMANNANGFAIFLYVVGGIAVALSLLVFFLSMDDYMKER